MCEIMAGNATVAFGNRQGIVLFSLLNSRVLLPSPFFKAFFQALEVLYFLVDPLPGRLPS